MEKRRAAIYRMVEAVYPSVPPFDPDTCFPEYPLKHRQRLSPQNHAYGAVRQALALLNLDASHYGTTAWNPLGEFISEDDHVLVKPNFVLDYHEGGQGLESVVTHGSIIRAVVDYVVIALRGRGKITIGDAPLQKGDFNKICCMMGIEEVRALYSPEKDLEINVVDLRVERVNTDRRNVITKRVPLKENEGDYLGVNLGEESFLAEVSQNFRRYRVTCYDKITMPVHHNRTTNAYLIPKSVLDAHVVINLPKLKTHRKAGITASLKNMVGINGHKDWLPHHRVGSVCRNGDEYPRRSIRKALMTSIAEMSDQTESTTKRHIWRILSRGILATGRIVRFKDQCFEGSWYGNDTLWRTVLDLNRLLLYCDKGGQLRTEKQRKYLSLVDGVVAGEGEGPLEPTPRRCGVIIAGCDPATVDYVCASLMGFDHRRIPAIFHAIQSGLFCPAGSCDANLEIASNERDWDSVGKLLHNNMHFKPSSGWMGHIEYAR